MLLDNYESKTSYHKSKIINKVQQSTCFVCNREKVYQNEHACSTFDLDPAPIMLDDGTSVSTTKDCKDLLHKPSGIRCNLKGIVGSAHATLSGTIQWYLDDNQAHPHKFIITNTYYIATPPTRILSPQHYAQQIQDHEPMAKGMGALKTANQ